MRFPGQYYDAETNTAYNYYRDYDPGVGRYVQSDPIGLRSGANTYVYTSGDPVYNIDALGLWDWPSIPEQIYNPVVGAADALSFGVGPLLRREYGISGPDSCSTSYKVGQAAALLVGILTGEGEGELAAEGAGAADELVTVTHFTNAAGVSAIGEGGMLNAGSFVTTSNLSGLSATEVESALEIDAGKGAFSTTFQTPGSNLGPAFNGPLTSGGIPQFQLINPSQVTIFVPTP